MSFGVGRTCRSTLTAFQSCPRRHTSALRSCHALGSLLTNRPRSVPLPSVSAIRRLSTPRQLKSAPQFAFGPSERTYPIRKKPDFVPVVQRWSALLPEDELVVGMFGVQSRQDGGLGLEDSPLLQWVDSSLLGHSHGPSMHDHARFTDAAGYANHIVTAYWTSASEYEAWRSDTDVEAWWTSSERLSEPGVWREIIRVPAERVETIYWVDWPRALCFAPGVELYPTPYAGYYGAMRDRLYLSGSDALEPPPGTSMQRVERDGLGTRWRVHPPLNFAIIRSAHTWGMMDDEQLADYKRKLLPSLEKGMEYLANNPEASGCANVRWQNTTDVNGAPDTEKHGTAYFLSLKQMEEWSEGHRTHAAIFHAALSRYKNYGENNQLRTWHEVFVLPNDREQLFEYINCHSDTGILQYFSGEQF